MENSNLTFECVIVKGENGYYSMCLDIDVGSEDDTVDEAKKNLAEAVELYIEDSIESNLPILRPVPEEENPIFNDPDKIVERFKIDRSHPEPVEG